MRDNKTLNNKNILLVLIYSEINMIQFNGESFIFNNSKNNLVIKYMVTPNN